MSEYPWNEKNNTFTWLSSLYNPIKCIFHFIFPARCRVIVMKLYELVEILIWKDCFTDIIFNV